MLKGTLPGEVLVWLIFHIAMRGEVCGKQPSFVPDANVNLSRGHLRLLNLYLSGLRYYSVDVK